jgi:type IV secretory pathway component VirB8
MSRKNDMSIDSNSNNKVIIIVIIGFLMVIVVIVIILILILNNDNSPYKNISPYTLGSTWSSGLCWPLRRPYTPLAT